MRDGILSLNPALITIFPGREKGRRRRRRNEEKFVPRLKKPVLELEDWRRRRKIFLVMIQKTVRTCHVS